MRFQFQDEAQHRACRMMAVMLISCIAAGELLAQSTTLTMGDRLVESQVHDFAKLALQGIPAEYPNKPSNVMVDADSVQSPAAMHPAFFGCFDWHSSVHGHWMLVRLLKQYPDHPDATNIRTLLDSQLTAEKMKAEADYFQQPHNKSFERMYGWAWLLRLVAELKTWEDEQGQMWAAHLKPLEDIIVQRTKDYLPLLTYPIRTGVHPDTGFALGQTLDYARTVNDTQLAQLIEQRSREYYLNDHDYPARFEPSGEDFFSSGLNEADLMRRLLKPDEFAIWLDQFMPSLGRPGDVYSPVEVSDVTDGKIVHLAGLDLSRAWTLHSIAAGLPEDDVRRTALRQSANAHLQAGLKYVFSGHYEGEHWLATFAVYAVTEVGVPGESN